MSPFALSAFCLNPNILDKFWRGHPRVMMTHDGGRNTRFFLYETDAT